MALKALSRLLPIRTPGASSYFRWIHTSSAVGVKEVKVTEEGDMTIIEGSIQDSKRKPFLLKMDDPYHACPMCALEGRGIKVRHTDVLILQQFLNIKHEMLPREITGLCKRQHRRVLSLVLMAQNAGLLPVNKMKVKWEKWNRYYDEETDIRDYKLKDLHHLKHMLPGES
ncbi:unnamed protein product [Darwinula stevensoni]|uniref:Mitochondrial ribosomal protein S18A n=1 Tax=Darwinula stevensoni TaxID=69355 RepID=A0A7R8ZZC5_9CRUS|nr:unnamed protein product [Darwinula stevensoni]CAG0882274.1 unnamed protein product [Darwinula stevensoni]